MFDGRFSEENGQTQSPSAKENKFRIQNQLSTLARSELYSINYRQRKIPPSETPNTDLFSTPDPIAAK